jgi:hypothetical protein
VECGVWNVVCGMWCVECGVWYIKLPEFMHNCLQHVGKEIQVYRRIKAKEHEGN